MKIRLNTQWIQQDDQPDAYLPREPRRPNLLLEEDIDDYRLSRLEDYGGTQARNNPVLQAAVRDLGQSGQSSTTSEKYVIKWSDWSDPETKNSWCSEFASWVIREEAYLSTPLATDTGIHIEDNLSVWDLWDYFYNHWYFWYHGGGWDFRRRARYSAEDIWDNEGAEIEPGDYVSTWHWVHSSLFIGWDGGFDPDADVNYVNLLGGGDYVGFSPHLKVCGPDADWVSDGCDVLLCLPGYSPGQQGQQVGDDECDFFGVTH